MKKQNSKSLTCLFIYINYQISYHSQLRHVSIEFLKEVFFFLNFDHGVLVFSAIFGSSGCKVLLGR